MMHQPIRATASAWALWRCSICGASAAAERHPGEAVVGLQILDGHRGPCLLSSLLWVVGLVGERGQVELAGELAVGDDLVACGRRC